MTLAIATYFKKGPILVGYDGRDSSPIIAKVVCSALNYAGLDCNNVGIMPTPCLEYAVKKLDYSGGIMITASHNPPQYNGIKPAAKDGVEISREDELIIEDIFLKKNWIKNPSKWGITQTEDKAIDVYVNGIISQIDSQKIKSKNLKVVLDLGNGAQAITAPVFCKLLGCETFLINEKIDGSFPGRGSEPTPQNLSELSKTVLQNNADLGIAFDGDGDRSIFCDNNGEILTGDKSALVLTKFILEKNPNSLVVTCLNSGSNIEVIANEFNSQVIRTKVGSVEESRKMVPTNHLIGFEETSSLPPSFTTKDKVTCSQKDSKKLIQTLKEEFPNSDTTDGIKIVTNSKNWVMIRPSGTEPIIRIYVEAESQQKLDTLMSKYLQKVKSVISDNTFKTNR